MRPNGVVLVPPSFDHHLGLSQCVEYLSLEQLISQFSIEAFVVTVLPGATSLDIEGLHSQIGQLLRNGCGMGSPPRIRTAKNSEKLLAPQI